MFLKIKIFLSVVLILGCSNGLSNEEHKNQDGNIEWNALEDSEIFRDSHEATLLFDGRVLITGSNIDEKTVELFDPVSMAWENLDSMLVGRSSHRAIQLNNGKVLVAGGYTWENRIIYSNSSEIFDPKSKTWELTDNMHEGRSAFSATLLNNGLVLVAGGFGENLSMNSAEIYNSSTEKWRSISPLNHKRALHQAVKLKDGRVLFIGGSGAENTCEIFNPVSEKFELAAPMKHSRSFHQAVLLNDGRVLVTGGGKLRSSEIYDPVSNNWIEVEPMSLPRSEHSMTVLPNDKVLVTGGNGPFDLTMTYPARIIQASSEIYDPKKNKWGPANNMLTPRKSHTVTLLNTNQLLVVGGGYKGGKQLTVEISNVISE